MITNTCYLNECMAYLPSYENNQCNCKYLITHPCHNVFHIPCEIVFFFFKSVVCSVSTHWIFNFHCRKKKNFRMGTNSNSECSIKFAYVRGLTIVWFRCYNITVKYLDFTAHNNVLEPRWPLGVNSLWP